MKIIRDVDDTFEAIFKPNINISCFYYPYKLLKPTLDGFLGRVYHKVRIAFLGCFKKHEYYSKNSYFLKRSGV